MNDVGLVLIGGAAGVVSSAFVGAATLLSNAFIQEREHRHGLAVERQRHEAERQAKEDLAVREMRKARMAPVLDMLATVEQLIQFDVLDRGLEEGVRPAFEAAMKEVLSDEDAARLSDDDKKKIAERVRVLTLGDADLKNTRHLLVAKSMITCRRIGDLALRNEVLSLVSDIYSGGAEARIAMERLGAIHEKIERYAARAD